MLPDFGRHPVPVLIDVGPTTVVVRSPAPSLIRNPCEPDPSVIRPVAVTIRGPVRGSVTGAPAVAIVRNVLPLAVVIEVVHASDVAISGDVLMADRPLICF